MCNLVNTLWLYYAIIYCSYPGPEIFEDVPTYNSIIQVTSKYLRNRDATNIKENKQL